MYSRPKPFRECCNLIGWTFISSNWPMDCVLKQRTCIYTQILHLWHLHIHALDVETVTVWSWKNQTGKERKQTGCWLMRGRTALSGRVLWHNHLSLLMPTAAEMLTVDTIVYPWIPLQPRTEASQKSIPPIGLFFQLKNKVLFSSFWNMFLLMMRVGLFWNTIVFSFSDLHS